MSTDEARSLRQLCFGKGSLGASLPPLHLARADLSASASAGTGSFSAVWLEQGLEFARSTKAPQGASIGYGIEQFQARGAS
jgi:hypothetical protein